MIILLVLATVVVVGMLVPGAKASAMSRATMVGWLAILAAGVLLLRLMPGPLRLLVALPVISIGAIAGVVWFVRTVGRQIGRGEPR